MSSILADKKMSKFLFLVVLGFFFPSSTESRLSTCYAEVAAHAQTLVLCVPLQEKPTLNVSILLIQGEINVLFSA